MNVVILDTGCANLNSVKSAIARHGYEPVVSRDPDVVLRADKLFLPGVGTAQAAMDQIRERDLSDLIKACTQPVLGICLGMQILGRRSEENNGVDLLGIIDEDVPKMTDHGLPLPHMGWTRVYAKAGDRLFRGIDAMMGGEERSSQSWMKTPNRALDGAPIDRITSVTGLVETVAYVDAARARV